MGSVTKMLTGEWCEAIDGERCAGPLSRMAARGQLPDGVDPSDPHVARRVRACRELVLAASRVTTASLPHRDVA
jgi:hypothetical protein